MPEANELPKGIGAPATRALLAAGCTKTADLDEVPEPELAARRGVGPKAIRIIRDALAERRQSLG